VLITIVIAAGYTVGVLFWLKFDSIPYIHEEEGSTTKKMTVIFILLQYFFDMVILMLTAYMLRIVK